MTNSRASKVTVVVALAAALPALAHAQNRDINTYVLFALQELRTKGPTLMNGDIGVNMPNGVLAVSPHGEINAPHSQIAADYIRSGVETRCQSLFSPRPVSPAMPSCGPVSPLALPIVADPMAACGFPKSFPDCDRNMPLVVIGGETKPLAPGAYGAVAVLSGGTLILSGGDYRFCSFRAARNASVYVQQAATVNVVDTVNLGNNVYLGPDPAVQPIISPRQVQLFVSGGLVHFASHADVHAALCAPMGTLRLTHEAHLNGMFVASRIRTERISGEMPPTTSTTTTSTTIQTTTTVSSTTSTSHPATTTTLPGNCSALCGNGHIDATCKEACDGHDFGNTKCPGGSVAGAFLVCNADCTIDFDECPNALQCGDGVKQSFEQCDPVALDPGCPAGKVCGAAGTPVGCQCVPPEICGNCIDDDGNGDTDFEDAACCPGSRTFQLGISQAKLRPRGSVSTLRLRTTLAEGLSGLKPKKQDVFVQIRPPGGADVFCAQLPADHFMPIRRGYSFWDKKHVVTSAKGINDAKVMARKNGNVRFRALGRKAQLRTPAHGPLQLTIGLRDAQAGDTANACSTETPAFRTGKQGRLIAP